MFSEPFGDDFENEEQIETDPREAGSSRSTLRTPLRRIMEPQQYRNDDRMNPPYFPPKSDWQSPQVQYQPYGQHGHYQQAWYEQTNRQISALFNSQQKLFERVCDR